MHYMTLLDFDVAGADRGNQKTQQSAMHVQFNVDLPYVKY